MGTASQRLSRVLFFALGLLFFQLIFAKTTDLTISALSSPIPVPTKDKILLVYELNIANTGKQPHRLGRIEIRDEHNKLLNSYYGDKLLHNSLVFPKRKQNHDDMNVELGPNQDTFIYIWVALNKNEPTPKRLNNIIWTIHLNADKSVASVKKSTYVVSVQDEKPPILGNPLEGNNWVAVAAIGPNSYHRKTILPKDGHFYLSQRYAIDWEKINDEGSESHGTMHNNQDWYAYGHKVLSAVEGQVVSIQEKKVQDNTPPGLPNPAPSLQDVPGNYIILQFNQNNKNYYLLYAHMQPNSIQVKKGDNVKKGQFIGLVGNSGNSGAPHLHMHVSELNEPLFTNGLPFVFEELTIQGYAKEIDSELGFYSPAFYKESRRFSAIIPTQNDIISFSPLLQTVARPGES